MDTVPIIISARDLRRLERMLELGVGASSQTAELLEAELSRADVRDPGEVPSDVVTMNSEVTCIDESSGKQQVLRLVYPDQADAADNRISVLAPIGAALLGLSVGQSITWPLPGNRFTRLRVAAITYQPEASGLEEWGQRLATTVSSTDETPESLLGQTSDSHDWAAREPATLREHIESAPLPAGRKASIHSIVKAGPPDMMLWIYMLEAETDLTVIGAHPRNVLFDTVAGRSRRILETAPDDLLMVRAAPAPSQ